MHAYVPYSILLLTICTTCSAQFYDINVDGIIAQDEWPGNLPLGLGNWYVAMKSSTYSIFVAVNWQISGPVNDTFMLGLEANPDPNAVITPNDMMCREQTQQLSFRATTYFCMNSTNHMEIYHWNSGPQNWSKIGALGSFALKNTSSQAYLEMEIPFTTLNPIGINSTGDNTITFYGIVKGSAVTVSSSTGISSYNFFLSMTEGLASFFPGFFNTYTYALLSGTFWNSPNTWFNGREPGSGNPLAANTLLLASTTLTSDKTISHLLIYPGVQLNLGGVLTVQRSSIPAVVYLAASASVTSFSGGYLQLINFPMAIISATVDVGTYFGTIALRDDGVINNSNITMVITDQFIFGGDISLNNKVLYDANSILVYEYVKTVRSEWPPVSNDSEITANIPVDVLLSNCQNCNLTITDNKYLVTRGDFLATNSSARVTSPDVNNGEMLRVNGSVTFNNSTITLETHLIADGIISLDSNSQLFCAPTGEYYVIHHGDSFYQFDANLCSNDQNCSTITDGDSFSYAETFNVTLLSSDFINIIWSDTGANTNINLCAGQTTCTFPHSTGNTTLSVTAEHQLSGCYSRLTFEVVTSTNINSTGTTSHNHDSNNSDEAGLISGLVVGGAALVTAGAITAILVKRRRRQRHLFLTSDVELRDRSRTLEWEIPFTELELGRELGRGAFGVVYKCRWRNTDCVAKQLDINRNDQQSIKQFLKEANNVKGLRPHPNVCNVFGICTDPKHPICIVMEYLPDGALDQLVYQNKTKLELNVKMILDFAKDIASGMSHIHQENVLHCDLACRNLLLTARGNNKYQIKIADFGLSRVTETETYNVSTNASFPVRWTAPETLVSGKIARASDVWSFGIVLWEIAEGKRPFPDLANSEVIKAVCDRGVRLSRPNRVQIPNELWDLMNRCWNTDPQTRPTFDAIYSELCQIDEKYFGVEKEPEQDNNTNVNMNNDNYNTIQRDTKYNDN